MNESWGKLITKIGVPSAIAIWLVYQLSGDMKGMILQTQNTLSAHVAATAPLVHSQQQLVNLALQNCISGAPNKAGQQACFAALVTPPQPPR